MSQDNGQGGAFAHHDKTYYGSVLILLQSSQTCTMSSPTAQNSSLPHNLLAQSKVHTIMFTYLVCTFVCDQLSALKINCVGNPYIFLVQPPINVKRFCGQPSQKVRIVALAVREVLLNNYRSSDPIDPFPQEVYRISNLGGKLAGSFVMTHRS